MASRRVVETGLFCPQCDYNLTGLTEDRCPECGRPFDRALLERLQSEEVRPATPWDVAITPRAFLATWWQVPADARAFARAFPQRHSVCRALLYSAICYLMAEALLYLSRSVIGHTASRREVRLYMAAAFLGWVFCETALAAALAVLVRPTSVRRRHAYHFWRGLTHYTSGFVLWMAAWWMGFCLLIRAFPHPGAAVGGLLSITVAMGVAAVFCWWVATLIHMIQERTRPGFCRSVACVAVPFIGLASIAFAILAGPVVSMFIRRVI